MQQTGGMGLVEVGWSEMSDPRRQGTAVLAAAVAAFCGVRTEDVRLSHLCRHCGSTEHGRPVVLPGASVPQPPEVSLSRTEDGVLVAVSDAGPVGVDVERLDAPGWHELDPVLLHPAEHPADSRDRAVTWVRKESVLKATGHGLQQPPDTVRVSDPGLPARLLEWKGPEKPATTWMYDVPVGARHVACLATLSPRAPRVVIRGAPEEAAPGARPGTAPRARSRSAARRAR